MAQFGAADMLCMLCSVTACTVTACTAAACTVRSVQRGPTFLPLFVSFFDHFQSSPVVPLLAPAQRLHASLVDLAFPICASCPSTEG